MANKKFTKIFLVEQTWTSIKVLLYATYKLTLHHIISMGL
jgi:hypothetical protein